MVVHEVQVPRTRQLVFAVVAEEFFANRPYWDPWIMNLQQTSTGPVDPNTTGQGVWQFWGRQPLTINVTEYQRPQRFAFTGTRGGFEIRETYAFTEHGGETRITCTLDLASLPVRFSALRPLLEFQIGKRVKTNMQRLQALLIGARRAENINDLLPDLANQQWAFAVVRQQGSNRLQVTSFLAGLTFAGLGALLPVIDAYNLNKVSVPDPGHLLPLIAGGLVAIATLILLLGAASSYQALRRINRIRPAAVTQLAPDPGSGAQPGQRTIPDADLTRLRDAYALHQENKGLVMAGLRVLLVAVIILVWQMNLWIGIIVGLFLAFMLIKRGRLRPEVLNLPKERSWSDQ